MAKDYQLGPLCTIVAGEALTKRRFVDATVKHTVDIPAVGVNLFDTDSGDPATIQTEGIAVVEAAGAITVGTHHFVSMDANGKAVALTLSSVADVVKICGTPLSSATTDGDFILVKLR